MRVGVEEGGRESSRNRSEDCGENRCEDGHRGKKKKLYWTMKKKKKKIWRKKTKGSGELITSLLLFLLLF